MRIPALILIALGAAAAQQDGAKPSFEVASVKPSPVEPGADRIDINLGNARHGTVTLANTTLSECLRYAYGLASEDQISGPEWIRDRRLRFDITAKTAPETPTEQILLMTQRLLDERFQLKMHREPRPVAHADLVLAGNGPKRSRSQEDGPSTLKAYGRGRLNYEHLPMRMLAVLLSRQLRETVVDRTGLTGYFEIDLQYTPETAGVVEPPDAADAPDIYKALQQQLGLKLVKSKTPIEVLVVDHAEKVPVGN